MEVAPNLLSQQDRESDLQTLKNVLQAKQLELEKIQQIFKSKLDEKRNLEERSRFLAACLDEEKKKNVKDEDSFELMPKLKKGIEAAREVCYCD